MSKSFDEGSPENNTVKILHVHEILKELFPSFGVLCLPFVVHQLVFSHFDLFKNHWA
jgi:hypothetical protein